MTKKDRYMCTYTSEEGAPCPCFFRKKYPSPKHCFAYDCRIWNINPDLPCIYLKKLEGGEKREDKIWCDQMSYCDSYNDGGIEKCKSCPCKRIVFKGDE